MALDSLLASLKREVSEVAGVQANRSKAFVCNPAKLPGVAEVSCSTDGTPTVTHETPTNPAGVSPKPVSIGACTLETPATPETIKREAETQEVGAGKTATPSRSWLLHYPDRDPVEVACCPDATHDEMLERHPDAITAEPFVPTVQQPAAPMTDDEEQAVLAWLELIEETDSATIAEVLHQCQHDADARDYFTGRTAADNFQKNQANAALNDDRRTCTQCANLVARRCLAAKRGEIVASRNYEPIRDMLKRCEGYAPGADDPDRRHGRERWPGLIQKGEK